MDESKNQLAGHAVENVAAVVPPWQVKFFRILDRIVFWLVAMPTMLIIQILIGGFKGLAIGFPVAMAVWFGYVIIKLFIMSIIGRRMVRQSCSDEVLRISDDWRDDQDADRTIARLEDVIQREGESFWALNIMVDALCDSGDADRALAVVERAESICSANQRAFCMVSKANVMRHLCRVDEALELTSHVTQAEAAFFSAWIMHAKLLADLSRVNEARDALAHAERLFKRMPSWLGLGVDRDHKELMRQDLQETRDCIAMAEETDIA